MDLSRRRRLLPKLPYELHLVARNNACTYGYCSGMNRITHFQFFTIELVNHFLCAHGEL